MSRRNIGSYSKRKLSEFVNERIIQGTGDISKVTAGNGLTGGGSEGEVSLAVDIAAATDGTGITVATGDLLLVADINDSNNVKKVEISQLPGSVAGSDTQIQYNNGGAFGGATSLTYNDATGHLTIVDDKNLYFGTDADASIRYDESPKAKLVISGSAAGIEITGSVFVLHVESGSAGGLGSYVALDSTNKLILTSSAGAQVIAGSDTQLQYNNAGAMGGTAGMSYDDATGYLGIGTTGGDITHALTLADNSGVGGKIKATAYTTYSSIRYKRNIKTIEDPLKIISNLRGVTYNWKNDLHKNIGFVAEEVGKHLPSIVEWEPDNNYAQSMDYTKIVPILVEAMKTQQKQIDRLKAQITFLKKD